MSDNGGCPTSHIIEELAPWAEGLYPSRRFLVCPFCTAVFWWDGPSVLAEKDPARKKRFSKELVELTVEQVSALRRL